MSSTSTHKVVRGERGAAVTHAGDEPSHPHTIELRALAEATARRCIGCNIHRTVRYGIEFTSNLSSVFSVVKGFVATVSGERECRRQSDEGCKYDRRTHVSRFGEQ
jgi:hypothetical protein